jgi:hypothetical protein
VKIKNREYSQAVGREDFFDTGKERETAPDLCAALLSPEIGRCRIHWRL